MPVKIVLNTAPGTLHGWGVYAMNVLLGWANDPEIEVWAHESPGCLVDAVRAQAMSKPVRWRPADADVWLHPRGNDFISARPLMGPLERTIAWTFFEAATATLIEQARQYPLIITGCTWSERLLRAAGIGHVRTIFQGCDRSLFHPAPRLGLFKDRFAIFSGGKAEWRKGQDIVLAAFKVFAARHPDALLVTAWQSPWPELAATCDQSRLAAPAVFTQDRVQVNEWAAATGINPSQVVDLGQVHHTLMPQVYRECDCAVFPARIELSQNLMACEAMACGLPVAALEGTGHEDLKPNFRIGVIDPVSSTIAAMEQFYTLRGIMEPARLDGFKWFDTCAQLKAACVEVAHA